MRAYIGGKVLLDINTAEQRKVIGKTLGRITKHLGAYNISRKYGPARITDHTELLLLLSNELVSSSDRTEISKAVILLSKINEIGAKIRDIETSMHKGRMRRDKGEGLIAQIRTQARDSIPKHEVEQVILSLGRISINFRSDTTLPSMK